MKLRVAWNRPVRLKEGPKKGSIYTVELEKIPRKAGVYVLARKWGTGGHEALYVGMANNLRGRIKGQLNNLKLMLHARHARGGRRVVLTGEIKTRPGQQTRICLPIIERALIRHFLSEGHDLVNKSGTKLRGHEVLSDGSHPKRFFPRKMYVERS